MLFFGQKSCMTMFRLYSSIVVINFVDLITSASHIHIYKKIRVVAVRQSCGKDCVQCASWAPLSFLLRRFLMRNHVQSLFDSMKNPPVALLCSGMWTMCLVPLTRHPRLLPMTARQIIMDLVFLDKPLTLEECQQLFRSHNDEAYSVALERMQRLSILMVRDERYM